MKNNDKEPNSSARMIWSTDEVWKATGGPLRAVTIRCVAHEGCHTITVKAPAGKKVAIMTPMVRPEQGTYIPEYDMLMVMVPDKDLELTVNYRRVSAQEYRAHYQSTQNVTVLHWPPNGGDEAR